MRTVPALALLLLVVAAGCGGAARPQTSADRGVPAALARGWEAQAAAIAAAASAHDGCRAMRLATALRDQVVASQRKVPVRLRSALLTGVNALAARTTCTPPPPPAKKPPPGHDHHDHGHHGHGHGGDGNDQ